MDFLILLIIFSSLSFFVYGFLCLSSEKMLLDFRRYDLEGLRITVGVLEILGAMGLVLGLFVWPILVLLSSGALSLLMLFACLIRLRFKDSALQIFPAFFYMLLNGFIFIVQLN